MIAYPQLHEYQALLQNPSIAFKSSDLRRSIVARDLHGLPAVEPGRFALTYRLLEPGGTNWAVRCFRDEVVDRSYRYRAISKFISQDESDYFARILFEEEGVRFAGTWYPITRMRWIEGVPLDLFIERNLTNSEIFRTLADAFVRLIRYLEKQHIAHGDLQHGNILVVSGDLKLVDYDGMFVPELTGRSSNEVGHPNYQHPARGTSDFDARLDRFSAIVIYLALRALHLKPTLWHRYSKGGVNILFQRRDFVNPDGSQLLGELEGLAELKPLVQSFRDICLGTISDIPSLGDFIRNTFIRPVPSRSHFPDRPTIDSIWYENVADLLRREGDRVEVVGFVESVVPSKTVNDTDCMFINFGDFRQGCFVGVLWSEGLAFLRDVKLQIRQYEGEWVSITGIVRQFEVSEPGTTKKIPRPEIVIAMPSQIEILPNRDAARSRLHPTPATDTAGTTNGLSMPSTILNGSISGGSATPAAPSGKPVPSPLAPVSPYGTHVVIGTGFARNWAGEPVITKQQSHFNAADSLAFVVISSPALPIDGVRCEIWQTTPADTRKVYGNEYDRCGIIGPLGSYIFGRPGKYLLRVFAYRLGEVASVEFGYLG